MSEPGETRIEHPNREKASSKLTRLAVVVLLIASAVLLATISWGGWGTLEGAKALQIAYIGLYLLMAFLVLRWSRGVLPVAGALAIVMLIFAAVAAPQWFDRDKQGFADPTLDEGLLGLLTLTMIPLQIVLIAFVTRVFQQAWNVEVERPAGDRGHDGRGERAGPSPAAT